MDTERIKSDSILIKVRINRIQADTGIIEARYRHGASRYRHKIQPVKNLVRMQVESFVVE